jgi:hypothetical protein
MKLKAAVIPGERWNSHEFTGAADQVRNAARRIAKGVDLARERQRFSSGCQILERAASECAGATELGLLDRDAAALVDLLPRVGAARLPFLSPLELGAMRSRLPSVLAGLPTGVAVVVRIDPFTADSSEGTLPVPLIGDAERLPRPDLSRCLAGSSTRDDVSPQLRRIQQQLRRALERGERLRLGTRSEFLVPAVRDFVYLSEAPFKIGRVQVAKMVPDEEAIRARERSWHYRLLKTFLPFLLPKTTPMHKVKVWEQRKEPIPVEPFSLTIVFQDGSMAALFPVLALVPHTRPNSPRVIRAGLMSVRHFELDSIVDFYLLRNAELPRHEGVMAADQEESAFAKAKQTLLDLLAEPGSLRVELYHTGLPPVLIGAYRAVVELLSKKEVRGRLEVVPMLYRGNTFVAMDPWY